MYAVLDIETGGFNKKKNAICEVAILILDNDLKVINEYQTLISPYIRCPEVAEKEGQLVSYKDDAMAVNGISMDDILKAPKAEVVANEIFELLEDHTVRCLIGHNLDAFDKPWIEDFMKRMGVNCIIEKSIDTMKLSKKKGNKINSLEVLCEQYKIENVEQHRALGDCYATLELLNKLNA